MRCPQSRPYHRYGRSLRPSLACSSHGADAKPILPAGIRYTASARGSRPRFSALMNTYAIISVGGKQYRVREGEKLLVDRLAHGEGKTFNPAVLLVGGGGSE